MLALFAQKATVIANLPLLVHERCRGPSLTFCGPLHQKSASSSEKDACTCSRSAAQNQNVASLPLAPTIKCSGSSAQPGPFWRLLPSTLSRRRGGTFGQPKKTVGPFSSPARSPPWPGTRPKLPRFSENGSKAVGRKSDAPCCALQQFLHLCAL